MTYVWFAGEPIAVTLDSTETPLTLTWRGVNYRVDGIANTWRVDMEWWRTRIWRDYFKVNTTSGLLLIVYHDLTDGQWCIQHLYD